jgi:NAD(P)-dependent dehydrogenase (short-subunit alcohol dehydrogenase family)
MGGLALPSSVAIDCRHLATDVVTVLNNTVRAAIPGARSRYSAARRWLGSDEGGPVAFDTTTDEVLADVDLTGRRAIVTGASTGLGLETARALAAAGAAVTLAARDQARVSAALDSIRERVPQAVVDCGTLDLTSLSSVRHFATWFRDQHDQLDILVNNAGVMATPFERTVDGFELQFGTNHLGHFLLTNLLTPLLLASAPSRIVNLSSGGHRSSDIIWDDPNYESRPYDKFEAYGQSKTANILFTVELDRRLRDHGVRAFAVHPGMIATELGRYMTRDDFKALSARAKSSPSGGLPARKSIEAGAATSVWAATAVDLHDRGGVYCEDCSISDQHAPWALDAESARRLWDLSESLVGQRFPSV